MTSTTPAELLHLHPTDVEIEENVRLDPRLNRDFSLLSRSTEYVPVLAVRTEGRANP